MRSAINTLLVIFSLMVAVLVSVSAKASCAIGIEREGVSWDWSKYGNAPYVCGNSCKSVLKDVSVCFPDAERCTGDFITDGNACPDSDGMVAGGDFPEPDNGGGDNGGGDNGGGDDDCLGGVCAYPADIRSLHDAINYAEESSFNVAGEAATGLKRTQILSVRAGIVGANYTKRLLDKLDQVRTEHFADMDAALNTIKVKTNSIESKMDSINTKVNTIATSTSSAATNLQQINQKLDGLGSTDYSSVLSSINNQIGSLNSSIYGAATNTQNVINNQTSSLNNTITGMGNNLTSAIYNSATMFGSNNDVKAAVEGLGSGISDIAKGVGDIKDGLSTGDYSHRAPEGEIDFVDMPLYQPSAIEELEAEAKELGAQYDEKVKEFKNVFSLDESRLKVGEFNDHAMQFTIANGQTVTGKSAVFPALVDVAPWIAAAILFVAILAGVRQLGN
ncbi:MULTISPECIES: hypothetical protein [Vibrio]|uniref:hypothetical protein n=1 Tax=Vibrio TaxID=662 RepID=UPI0001B93FA8|nr:MULTISPECIES: hypothetical protein [Vibrio]EEX34504.1 hypothetical protein VIC_001304 [Vibrio coralliilyticus ATCC BAA-450]MDE3898544.1 hypothetical protein [Vibrio sp. CC007]